MSDTDWKKKCQELENEMVLIKGITVDNSPEMREATKKISELEEGRANSLDLSLLIDQHKKEIWKYKMKEAEWVKTQNQLDGTKIIVEELSRQIIDLRRDNKILSGEIENYQERLNKIRYNESTK